jgi:hypothetical protein
VISLRSTFGMLSVDDTDLPVAMNGIAARYDGTSQMTAGAMVRRGDVSSCAGFRLPA